MDDKRKQILVDYISEQVSAFLFPKAIAEGSEGLYKGDRQVRYSCCWEIRAVDSKRSFTASESMG